MCQYVAERYEMTVFGMVKAEEVLGDAFEGLLEAYRLFDPDAGLNFNSYAKNRMRWKILDNMRAYDQVPRLERIREKKGLLVARKFIPFSVFEDAANRNDPTGTKAAEELFASVLCFDVNEDRYHDAEVKSIVDLMVLCGKDRREREVIAKYALGYTMKEIGKDMKLTESRICQIFAKFRARIRHHMRARGYPLNPPNAAEIRAMKGKNAEELKSLVGVQDKLEVPDKSARGCVQR